jgi:signal peptide peptidase SppA
MWGINATGYDEISEQIAEALADDKVEGIHLQISSPGGMIDGLADTADAIYSAREIKPVTATIEDLGASAAYWIASQAITIDANRTTEVGSIGVYTVYLDWTKFEEEMGVKVIVIRSGEHKGMGIDGVSENQIAAVQEIIDALADNFINAVAAGRNKSSEDIRKLATGRLWIAETALELGLIDGIKEIESASENTNINKGAITMENDKEKGEQLTAEQIEKTASTVATAAATAAVENERTRMGQMQAEFADDPEFAMKAFAEGKSLAEAKAEYCDVLREKVKATEEKAEQANKANKTKGASPLENSGSGDGQGGGFIAAAKELAEAKGIKLGDAFKKVAREQPELYAAHKNSLVA